MVCVWVFMFICVCSSCFQPLELQHDAAACQSTLTSEDHPLNTVSLSPCLCAISLPPISAHFIEKAEGALCFFPAGTLDFWIICPEAQIKSVNSVSSFLSLPQTTFCMLRSFFMLSPPRGCSFFYVALISLVLVMRSVRCTLISLPHHINLV